MHGKGIVAERKGELRSSESVFHQVKQSTHISVGSRRPVSAKAAPLASLEEGLGGWWSWPDFSVGKIWKRSHITRGLVSYSVFFSTTILMSVLMLIFLNIPFRMLFQCIADWVLLIRRDK